MDKQEHKIWIGLMILACAFLIIVIGATYYKYQISLPKLESYKNQGYNAYHLGDEGENRNIDWCKIIESMGSCVTLKQCIVYGEHLCIKNVQKIKNPTWDDIR